MPTLKDKIAVVTGGSSVMNVPVLVVDGVVKLPPEANGAIVIGGSNATIYAAYFSAKAGARAAIHHDCGIGRGRGSLYTIRQKWERGKGGRVYTKDKRN